MIHVSVQGHFFDQTQWIRLAEAVDRSVFDCLYVADHPGSSAAPFVALAAAATVTHRVRLGTCVLNAGLWDPMTLGAELVTLDALSSGRAVLGVGAGHTPTEWEMVGLDFPHAGRRVDRLIELVDAVRRLLAGDSVSTSGENFGLRQALLRKPAPVQGSIPLMVGGNGTRVLSFAAEQADIVGVTGLGKTLSNGHSHEADWGPAALDRSFDVVHSAAKRVGRHPDIEALVQHVEITDDPQRLADRLAEIVPGASSADLLGAPFMWIGTPELIAAKVRDSEQRWGINRYVIRGNTIEAAGPVLDLLPPSD
jgi:probable F420-dependent oxidoreductase